MTAPQIIKMVLECKPNEYLAVHEITDIARRHGHYISDNAASTRLCIELKGEVESRYRKGKHFKEWRILPAEPLGNNGDPLPPKYNEDGPEER
jgi:hypothetical protein